METLNVIDRDPNAYREYIKWRTHNASLVVKKYGAVVGASKVQRIIREIINICEKEKLCMDLEEALIIENLREKRLRKEIPMVNSAGEYIPDEIVVKWRDASIILRSLNSPYVKSIIGGVLGRWRVKNFVLVYSNVKEKQLAENIMDELDANLRTVCFIVPVYIAPDDIKDINNRIKSIEGVEWGSEVVLIPDGLRIKDARYVFDNCFSKYWHRYGDYIALIDLKAEEECTRIALERVCDSMEEWIEAIVNIRRKRQDISCILSKQIYYEYYLKNSA